MYRETILFINLLLLGYVNVYYFYGDNDLFVIDKSTQLNKDITLIILIEFKQGTKLNTIFGRYIDNIHVVICLTKGHKHKCDTDDIVDKLL